MAKTYRFGDEAEQRIARLLALRKDNNETQLIRDALRLYEDAQHQHQARFMELYDRLSDAIQLLEVTRDYGREGQEQTGYQIGAVDRLTDDERTVYEWYNRIWEQMREQPFFHEGELPE